jgi:hypothetical protein
MAVCSLSVTHTHTHIQCVCVCVHIHTHGSRAGRQPVSAHPTTLPAPVSPVDHSILLLVSVVEFCTTHLVYLLSSMRAGLSSAHSTCSLSESQSSINWIMDEFASMTTLPSDGMRTWHPRPRSCCMVADHWSMALRVEGPLITCGMNHHDDA